MIQAMDLIIRGRCHIAERLPEVPSSRYAYSRTLSTNDTYATLCQRRGEARIKWIHGKLSDPNAEPALGRTIKPVKNLFGFMRDRNAVAHSPRSRLYSSSDFTRPAATS